MSNITRNPIRALLYQYSLFATCCVIILTPGRQSSIIIDIASIIVCAICSRALFVNSLPSYSLYKMVHLFFLLFLCIAPAMQFKAKADIYGIILKEDEYYFTYFYVILALVVYNFTYWKIKNIKQHKLKPTISAIGGGVDIDRGFILDFKMICLALLVFFFVFYLNSFNILSMFVRGGIIGERIELSTPQALLRENFLRPINLFVFLLSIYTKRSFLTKLVLFGVLLVTAFPLGMPRFAVAAMYIPILLICFPKIREGHTFILLLTIGILIVFPILSGFRDNYLDSDISLSIRMDFSQFENVDYDSFSQFSHVVENNVITYGRQLLGIIFFWVPRSIWTDKPVGSGDYIVEVLNMDAENIAMCFLGEGYINFGFIGVIFYACLLGYITKRLDIWHIKSFGSDGIKQIVYYVLVGFITFFLRGDMMGATAYCIGYIMAYMLAKKIILGSCVSTSV